MFALASCGNICLAKKNICFNYKVVTYFFNEFVNRMIMYLSLFVNIFLL